MMSTFCIDLISRYVGSVHMIAIFDKIKNKLVNLQIQARCRVVQCSSDCRLIPNRHICGYKLLKIEILKNNFISYPVKTYELNFPDILVPPTWELVKFMNKVEKEYTL